MWETGWENPSLLDPTCLQNSTYCILSLCELHIAQGSGFETIGSAVLKKIMALQNVVSNNAHAVA